MNGILGVLKRAGRRTLRLAVAGAGVTAILGSGGGMGNFWGCYEGGGEYCGPFTYPPGVQVQPRRITVAVGSPVSFVADVYTYTPPKAYTLQWCRRAALSNSCAPIAGATGATLTLPAVNLTDDGATYVVTVTDSGGSSNASGALTVSSGPGLAFADGDFAPAAWSVAASIVPARADSTWSAVRSASGGQPDAYLALTYGVGTPPGTIGLFHSLASAVYDPASQGALRAVDFEIDCARVSSTVAATASLRPMIEQAGRRFAPVWAAYSSTPDCYDPSWRTTKAYSVAADEFELIDGPACVVGVACPDFSAQAPSIRLGFTTAVDLAAGARTDAIVQGIDNWKAMLWRR